VDRDELQGRPVERGHDRAAGSRCAGGPRCSGGRFARHRIRVDFWPELLHAERVAVLQDAARGAQGRAWKRTEFLHRFKCVAPKRHRRSAFRNSTRCARRDAERVTVNADGDLDAADWH
jgi:hypothetical protein